MPRFFHVHLRTLEVEAARSFYAAVLRSDDLRSELLPIVRLHEQAIARGARPHWLGFIDVDDVDRAAAAFVQRGASSLGPKWINPQGLEAHVLRDPGGAIVAVAKPPAHAPESASAASGIDVAWHALNTADAERAKGNYSELFGWVLGDTLALDTIGNFQTFAWKREGTPIGSIGDIAGRPSIHPHWLFHFRVPALEPAIDAVRAADGKVLTPITLPNGDRVAVCDDPQGAAFALIARSVGER